MKMVNSINCDRVSRVINRNDYVDDFPEESAEWMKSSIWQ
jgi:hypothetical protein